MHESIYDQFLDAVLAEVRKKPLLCEEPENPEGLQPLIDDRQRHQVMRYIETGKQEGARLLYGGEIAADSPGFYLKPTVFADVKDEHTIAKEEIFGELRALFQH